MRVFCVWTELCVDSAFVFVRYATVMTEGQPLPTGEGMKPAFEYEGDLSVLSDVQNLAESGTRQAGLFVLGGLMRSASGMAQLTELEKRTMSHAFKYAVGMSAGVLGASYFLAGRMGQVTETTLQICCGNEFIKRNGAGRPGAVQIELLRELFEGKHGEQNSLPVDALPIDADMLCVVAREDTKKPIVLSLSAASGSKHVYNSMQASMALTKFTSGPVALDIPIEGSVRCEDAVPYAPMPFEQVLLRYQNVNPIVVVANAPKSLNGLTKVEKQHFETGIAELKKYCDDNNKKYLILYAHEQLGTLDNNRTQVDAVMQHVGAYTEHLLNTVS